MSTNLQSLHTEFLAHKLRSELNFPLAPLTTYAVGGAADCAVWASSESDVLTIARILQKHPHIAIHIVGRGSNLLVADEGFHGVAVIMSTPVADTNISVEGDVVRAPATMTMPVLARRTAAAGRGGLEWCVGIPGTVGGAVRMNAGGHGSEMLDSLLTARIVSLVSGEVKDIDVSDLGLHFRGSALAHHHVVVSASFRTATTEVADATKEIDEVVAWRREHQPGGRNAGSVFVNPAQGEGSAGALIDSAGLRTFTVGGATVSEKHANFVQATESASASDIVAVMTHVQEQVEKVHGIHLRSEVQMIGFASEIVARFSDPRHSDADRLAATKKLSGLLGENR